MADIQIVYIEGKCAFHSSEFCSNCLTSFADFTNCKMYEGSSYLCDYDTGKSIKCIGGMCNHAEFTTKHKGWTGKRYEMEMIDNPEDPYNGCMRVTLGKTEYACTKVTLDGKCIHGETEG